MFSAGEGRRVVGASMVSPREAVVHALREQQEPPCADDASDTIREVVYPSEIPMMVRPLNRTTAVLLASETPPAGLLPSSTTFVEELVNEAALNHPEFIFPNRAQLIDIIAARLYTQMVNTHVSRTRDGERSPLRNLPPHDLRYLRSAAEVVLVMYESRSEQELLRDGDFISELAEKIRAELVNLNPRGDIVQISLDQARSVTFFLEDVADDPAVIALEKKVVIRNALQELFPFLGDGEHARVLDNATERVVELLDQRMRDRPVFIEDVLDAVIAIMRGNSNPDLQETEKQIVKVTIDRIDLYRSEVESRLEDMVYAETIRRDVGRGAEVRADVAAQAAISGHAIPTQAAWDAFFELHDLSRSLLDYEAVDRILTQEMSMKRMPRDYALEVLGSENESLRGRVVVLVSDSNSTRVVPLNAYSSERVSDSRISITWTTDGVCEFRSRSDGGVRRSLIYYILPSGQNLVANEEVGVALVPIAGAAAPRPAAVTLAPEPIEASITDLSSLGRENFAGRVMEWLFDTRELTPLRGTDTRNPLRTTDAMNPLRNTDFWNDMSSGLERRYREIQTPEDFGRIVREEFMRALEQAGRLRDAATMGHFNAQTDTLRERLDILDRDPERVVSEIARMPR